MEPNFKEKYYSKIHQQKLNLNNMTRSVLNADKEHANFIVENNTFETASSGATVIFGNNDNNISNTDHTIDKIIELGKEKEVLFERLIKIEQERNSELRNQLDDLRKSFL